MARAEEQKHLGDVIRDPAPLWPWLRGFVVVNLIALATTAALNTILQLHLFQNAVPQDLLDLAFGLAALVAAITYIACIVLVARMTFRMMKNLHEAGAAEASIGPRWAVGWYFIPFANLIMPMRAVTEIWKGTFDELNEDNSPNGRIGLWWLFWIGGNLLFNVSNQMAGRGSVWSFSTSPDGPEPFEALVVEDVANLSTIVAGIFLLIIFGTLAKAQRSWIQAKVF
jgi:hypothetical protein